MQTNKHERSIILSVLTDNARLGICPSSGYIRVTNKTTGTIGEALQTGYKKNLFVYRLRRDYGGSKVYYVRFSRSFRAHIEKEFRKKLGLLHISDKTLPDQLLKGLLLDFM